MKAIIFAAGIGSRLKPFTDSHPKALVPVAGVPMLERVINKLKSTGVDEFVVNVHHFADQIKGFLRANDNFGTEIHISDESGLLLDTGGGLLKARQWLSDTDEPFIAHNADILTDAPLYKMISAHKQAKADITLLAAHRSTSRYLLFDTDMRMHGWTNIATGEVKPPQLNAADFKPMAFGGVHIISPAIFNDLQSYADSCGTAAFSLMPFYISACPTLRIYAHQQEQGTYWHDVGKPQSLAHAEESLK